MTRRLPIALLLLGASPVFAQNDAARIAALEQRIAALEKALAERDAARQAPAPPSAVAAASPAAPPAAATQGAAAPGAPRSAAGGPSIRLTGRLHLDAGHVSNPGVSAGNLGWSANVRRVRLGAAGDFGGGFSFAADAELSDNEVEITDAFLEWSRDEGPLTLRVGQFFPFHSLETLTSSNRSTFLERGVMHGAFDYSRRIGGAAEFEAGPFTLQGGFFTRAIGGTPDEPTGNDFSGDSRQVSARLLFQPDLGADDRQIHLAASFNRRRFDGSGLAFDYAAAPAIRLGDVEFVGTGNIAARGDRVVGVEAAASVGPWHAAAEANWLRVDALPGAAALRPGEATTGDVLLADPRLFAAYAEVGYALTGEHRPLDGGEWGSGKVARSLADGGPGAWRLSGRIEHLSLTDGRALLNGGDQTTASLALVWRPVSNVRLLFQGSRNWIDGGPFAAEVGDADYAVNAFATRFQFNF